MAQASQEGFTLIETLVALAIAATTAAVVLANVHGLRQRAAQERAHVLAALNLLNDSVIATRGGVPTIALQGTGDYLLLTPQREGTGPALTVRNFSLRDEKPLPPLQVAHTPLQRFSIETREGTAGGGHFSISFVAPAVEPPQGYERSQ